MSKREPCHWSCIGKPKGEHSSSCPKSFRRPAKRALSPVMTQSVNPQRLNARQFFDVWIGAVQGVRCAVGPSAYPVPVCRAAVESVISWVHGDSVGLRAAAYFDALLLECRERRGL